MAVQEVDLIADLPLSLGVSSKIWTADVHGITNGKKRKRLEVAVAIDGGCVNIYDVRSRIILQMIIEMLIIACRLDLLHWLPAMLCPRSPLLCAHPFLFELKGTALSRRGA